MTEKKLRIKLTLRGAGYCVMDPLEAIGIAADEVGGLDSGAAITFEGVEMTDEEFDALPEFEGW